MSAPAVTIDLKTIRAKKARLGYAIGETGVKLLALIAGLLLIGGLGVVIYERQNYGYFLLSGALVCLVISTWTEWDLLVPSPAPAKDINERLSADILSRLKPADRGARQVWLRLAKSWQTYFLANHLLLPSDSIEVLLSNEPASLAIALDKAAGYADSLNHSQIEVGMLAAAILATNDQVVDILKQTKASPQDIDAVTGWLVRIIQLSERKKENFGGIGRDWAFGFTNFLNRFSNNVSLAIIRYGSNFGWLTDSADVKAIENALASQGGAVAIIGPTGIGKTSRVYALAQRMIEGKSSSKLAYHQILKLDASIILSRATHPGELEFIFNRMLNEAAAAGHIILFLDDAEIFFKEGVGSFNASALLQPILQNRSIRFILTLTPEDYQRLRVKNATLATLLKPIILNELPQEHIMKILEDSAGGLENRYKCLITYDAIKAAYRLSGRFNAEEAYPGKAIKLLEQAIAFKVNTLVDDHCVEQAIEQAYGVKVSAAKPAEAAILLNLEDQIHHRMINQNEAVKAVASALRRARAGVSNPNRPIGSFLFLGPTGVGKTELAKAIAATYFGGESNIIRLDMSEYQSEADVSRLLEPGSDQTANISFLMSIRQRPFSVVLLDEVEKAHPGILNLLLQLLDEAQLTDSAGHKASFKDAVVIATSNAGADIIAQQIAAGNSLGNFKDSLIEQLINANIFKPELLNRFDEIVLFRPLDKSELGEVVKLLLKEVNANLAKQNIAVELTDNAIQKIVNLGSDERFGARPMRRALQKGVEDSIAQKILSGEVNPGSTVTLDDSDIDQL